MHSKNFIDLTGQHLGYYDVIKEAPQRVQPNGKIVVMWYCRCVCGKYNEVSAAHLLHRPNISCGCMKKSTLIDLTGQTFNQIYVESRAPDTPRETKGKKRVNWNCICLSCGKHFVLDGYNIKAGKQKSCGCMNGYYKSTSRFEDLTDETIGRLYVEGLSHKKQKKSGINIFFWNCTCSCGKQCVKTSDYLKNSPTPSCGCWKSEITSERVFKDLSGQKFGLLTIMKRVEDQVATSGNKKVMYLCKCECGSEVIVSAGNLRSGLTKSCGCLKSKGEYDIRKWLNERGIVYEPEAFYDDLLSPNGYPLRFDFAVYSDVFDKPEFLIEYQGIQHYVEGEFGKFEREITDRMKKEYCSAHGIILYEIRYDEDINIRLNEIFAMHVNFVPSSITEKV